MTHRTTLLAATTTLVIVLTIVLTLFLWPAKTPATNQPSTTDSPAQSTPSESLLTRLATQNIFTEHRLETPDTLTVDTPIYSVQVGGSIYAVAISNPDRTNETKSFAHAEQLEFITQDLLTSADIGQHRINHVPFERATIYEVGYYPTPSQLFTESEYGPLTVDYLDHAYYVGNTVWGAVEDTLVYLWPVTDPATLSAYDTAYLSVVDDLYDPTQVTAMLNAFAPTPVDTYPGLPATPGLNTYRNEFFPGLAIKYPDTWKFTTETRPTTSPDLLARTVTLTQDEATLNFGLTPFLQFPCGDGGAGINPPSTEPRVEFDNGYREYLGPNPSIDFTYGRDARCISQNILTSNIPLDDITSPANTLNAHSDNSETVDYYLHITARSLDLGDSPATYDPTQLNQIRRIIGNSEFGIRTTDTKHTADYPSPARR